MRSSKTRQLCLGAGSAALVFIVTRFLQVPIPFGYFHLGNAVILVSCLVLPGTVGIWAGCIGSALADLTSYPVYTLPTILIKLAMAVAFCGIAKHMGKDARRRKLRQIPAVWISLLIPLFGYTLTGGLLYGGLAASLAQLPGLLAEYAAGGACVTVALASGKRLPHMAAGKV